MNLSTKDLALLSKGLDALVLEAATNSKTAKDRRNTNKHLRDMRDAVFLKMRIDSIASVGEDSNPEEDNDPDDGGYPDADA